MIAAGGKALGLDRLRALGLPVPPYATILPGEPVPLLRGGPYAVRSSAANEDGETHSRAGQYLTRLNVPAEELAAAVAEVAASGAPPIPVLVQAMVRAQWAGVVFTADPRSGDVEQVVVEWVEGLGDTLVGGMVSPQRAEFPTAEVPVLPEPVMEAVQAALRVGESGPTDVEWAYGPLVGETQAQLWLLQARPITTAQPKRLALANTNTRELFPEALRPMSTDVAQEIVRRVVGPLLRPFGVDPTSATLLTVVRGRALFTLNPVVAWMRTMPGLRWASPSRLAELLGGEDAALAAALARLRPGDLPFSELSSWAVLRGGLRHVVGLWRHRSGTAPADLARVQAETAALAAPPSELDDAGLLRRVQACLAETDTPAMLPAASMGFLCAGIAQALGRRWDLPAARWLATTRTAGGSAGEELRGLGPDADLTAFLARWGHRASGELDVALPRWAEEPERLRAQLLAGTRRVEPDPPEPTGWRAALVRAIARRGSTGLATRESFKDDLIRRVGHLRLALQELGRRLTARGLVGSADEVFFLHLDELAAALAGEIPDLLGRRARWEAERRAPEPPGVLVLGDAGWREPATEVGEGDLRGLPASPGRAIGRARLRTHGDLRPLHPGDVLLAPFTDPGWTPLLAAAGAVITDFGGVLSHASIIARELRVPAVVNCKDATRRIPDGALVEVDGTQGTVVVLSGPETTES